MIKKHIAILILIFAVMVTAVIAQTSSIPADMNTAVIQKIDLEHKNTRKFVSDELTRQRTEFFKEMDDRANYYETTANNLISTAILKLGLLWAGIVLFSVSITQFLNMKLERNRFDKLLKTIRSEVRNNMMVKPPQEMTNKDNIANTQRTMVDEAPTPPIQRQELSMVGDKIMQPPKPTKKRWSQRRKEQKLAKKIQQVEKEYRHLKQLKNKLSGLPPQSKPKSVPDDIPQNPEITYNHEVNYGNN